jgi:hypothetical protein
MKWTKKSSIIIFIILLLSCKNDKPENSITPEGGQPGSVTGLNSLSLEEELSSVIDLKSLSLEEELGIRILLLAKDEMSVRLGYTILSIRDHEFGIPDGKNWLVEWGYAGIIQDMINGKKNIPSTKLVLYAINDYEIVKRFDLGSNFNMREYYDHDISPDNGAGRTSFGTGSTYYGNFTRNYDSEKNYFYRGPGEKLKIDFFRYGFYGNWVGIQVFGYDEETDDIKMYLEAPFSLPSFRREYNGNPAAFVIYKGQYGIMALYNASTVAGGPHRFDEPDPSLANNGKWFFYIWDKSAKEYVVLEEVDQAQVPSWLKGS